MKGRLNNGRSSQQQWINQSINQSIEEKKKILEAAREFNYYFPIFLESLKEILLDEEQLQRLINYHLTINKKENIVKNYNELFDEN